MHGDDTSSARVKRTTWTQLEGICQQGSELRTARRAAGGALPLLGGAAGAAALHAGAASVGGRARLTQLRVRPASSVMALSTRFLETIARTAAGEGSEFWSDTGDSMRPQAAAHHNDGRTCFGPWRTIMGRTKSHDGPQSKAHCVTGRFACLRQLTNPCSRSPVEQGGAAPAHDQPPRPKLLLARHRLVGADAPVPPLRRLRRLRHRVQPLQRALPLQRVALSRRAVTAMCQPHAST